MHLWPRATAPQTQLEAIGLAAILLASALRILRARAWNGLIIASLGMLGLGRLLLLLTAAPPWVLMLVITTTASGRATRTRAPLSQMRRALHMTPGVSTVSTLVP